MSSSFNFLPNVKEPKYDDKSWENPLKKLHELDWNENEIPVEFNQNEKFRVCNQTETLPAVYYNVPIFKNPLVFSIP